MGDGFVNSYYIDNGWGNSAGFESGSYNGVKIEYSGYNGDGTGRGNEYIQLKGLTNNRYGIVGYGSRDDLNEPHTHTMDGQIFIGSKGSDGKWDMEVAEVVGMDGKKPYILAFAQDSAGEVYALTSITTGPNGSLDTIYKIVPAQ